MINRHNLNKFIFNCRLFILGYRQSGEVFKNKLGSFRKYCSKYVEFVFPTAPHKAPPLEGETESNGYSWWFNKDDGTFKGTNLSGPAWGFDQSFRHLEEVWNTQGPFQGILGFSQGACLAGILSSLSVRGLTVIDPRFVIICAGFKSGSLVHKSFYLDPITIPSLHIYGETDEIISKAMSLELAECFEAPSFITHKGGHYFPATAQQKQLYIDFFIDQLQDYLEEKELEGTEEDLEEIETDSKGIPESEGTEDSN